MTCPACNACRSIHPTPYPRDRHGMYETYAGGRFHRADTLEGIRATIRAELEGFRDPIADPRPGAVIHYAAGGGSSVCGLTGDVMLEGDPDEVTCAACFPSTP